MFSLFSKKLPVKEQIEIIRKKTLSIAHACNPKRIILIGSASRCEMTEASDVDLVVIIDETTEFKRASFQIAHSRKGDPWPQDVLLISGSEFEKKSQIGGVFWIAAQEGIEVFPRFTLRGEYEEK